MEIYKNLSKGSVTRWRRILPLKEIGGLLLFKVLALILLATFCFSSPTTVDAHRVEQHLLSK